LPGIPRLGRESLLQGQSALHGELELTRGHGPLPLLAQLGQLLLPLRQLPRQIVDHLQNEPLQQRGLCHRPLILAELGQITLGMVGKPAELADGHPEQLVEVIVPRRLRRVLGQQHQGVIESIIQTQHQGARSSPSSWARRVTAC
jgi:hypothetical protein